MSNNKAKLLVIVSAVILLFLGAGLYILFDKQGYSNYKKGEVVSYNLKDYIETVPIVFNDYDDVYSSINVSKVNIKNINNDAISVFSEQEDEIISYITDYYKELETIENYVPVNSVSSNIKTQINGTVLSVFYEVNFVLDENIFEDSNKSYIAVINIDLATEKALSNDDLLSKYNYTKEYISEKIFEEDVLISNGQVVIDKNTNISLTQDDISRKKESYVDVIINQFDNIMKVYIENNSLAIGYDEKELKNLFFDNKFDTNIKIRYLK
ncbi:MAG: hypothetical protein ACI31S_05645 [Bacilli bacterium]